MKQSVGGSILKMNELGSAVTVITADNDPDTIEKVVDAEGNTLYSFGGSEE